MDYILKNSTEFKMAIVKYHKNADNNKDYTNHIVFTSSAYSHIVFVDCFPSFSFLYQILIPTNPHVFFFFFKSTCYLVCL